MGVNVRSFHQLLSGEKNNVEIKMKNTFLHFDFESKNHILLAGSGYRILRLE